MNQTTATTRREFMAGAAAALAAAVIVPNGEAEEPAPAMATTEIDVQPNQWYFEGMWRAIFPWDEGKAKRARHRLAMSGSIPPETLRLIPASQWKRPTTGQRSVTRLKSSIARISEQSGGWCDCWCSFRGIPRSSVTLRGALP